MTDRQEQFSPLLELTKTRLREFFREKGIVFWVFGFPILMALGLGLAFRSRPPDKPKIAVVAEAGSALADALMDSDQLVAQLVERPVAAAGLAHARFDLVVELPPPTNVAAGVSAAVPVFRYDTMKQGSALARAITDSVLQRAAGRADAVNTQDETHSPPGSRYIDFLIPGLIGMNIMGGSMWGVGYNLVVARKRRLLRRYAVTPMRRSHFLLSYFFSRSVFLVLELGILVVFGALVFGTLVQGSYAALGLAAVAGAASFGGLSLLIGARVENTEVAQGWMNFVQLPMWVLSGVFFSTAQFPVWAQSVIALLPLTALVDALRLVFNDGAGVLAVWSQLVTLTVWALVGFWLALRAFRWQ